MANIINEKSFAFAVRCVKMAQYLQDTKKEFVMSKQLLRCGTSVGANVREAQYGESKKDFIHKLAIAQKECNESLYWVELLYATSYLTEKEHQSIQMDLEELLKILTSIIVTTKKTMNG